MLNSMVLALVFAAPNAADVTVSEIAKTPVILEEPKLYLSVFVHPDYEKRSDEKRLLTYIEDDVRLLDLRQEVHFGISRDGETDKYPILPVVVLQKKRVVDGETTYVTVYKSAGDNVPWTATGLYHDLSRYVEVPERKRILDRFRDRRDCDDGDCGPGPKPVPVPHPEPDDEAKDEPAPAPLPPKEEEIPQSVLIALLVGAVGCGVIVGLAVASKRYKDEL